MRITILCVGKIKEKFYKDAIGEYSKRLSKYCKLNIIEVEDEETSENAGENLINTVKNKEGQRLKKHIKDGAYVISLAIEGEKFDSVELSEKIEKTAINGFSEIVFIIGGSLGISDEIKKMSNLLLSFSDMTFPHQLMRVILLEQIYRSYRIINNEPYHK